MYQLTFLRNLVYNTFYNSIMGITKNHLYTQDQIELARLFKALGHPARIAIIENLLEKGDLNCNDLRSFIQLAQSTISEHMKQLHEVGVLAVKVVKRGAYYQPVKEALEQITNYLGNLFHQINTTRKHDTQNLYVRPLQYISPHHPRNQT